MIIMRGLIFLIIACMLTLPKLSYADERGYAIAWMQKSAEYKAVLSQTFKAASSQLQEAIFDNQWTAAIEQFNQNGIAQLPNAIILDLDDSLISTMLYHGELHQDGEVHNLKDWHKWVLNGKAPIVPYVKTLIEKSSSLGVTVLLISDRICYPTPRDPCPIKTQTLKMLKRLSLVFPKDHMFFRGEYSDWNADQSTRRSFIAQRYRILMIIGDDLNQMIPKSIVTPHLGREKFVNQYNDMWGSRWFMLPNPVYGSWRDTLPKDINKAISGYHNVFKGF